MPNSPARSINSQLTRFSTVALAVLVVSIIVAAVAIYRAVDRWQVHITPRVSHGVYRLFERQAEEAAQRVREHAGGREAAAMLRARTLDAGRQFFTDDMANWLSRYGYTFVVVANGSGRPVFTWTREHGAQGRTPALPRAMFARIDSAGPLSGYLRLDDVVWLVAGAPLQGDAGVRSQGYLVLGMPVDRPHLDALGRDFSTYLSLRLDAAPPPAPVADAVAHGDTLVFRQALPDLFGAPIGTIEAAFERREFRQFYQVVIGSLLLALIGGAITIALVWRSGRRLLVVPARTMAREVEGMRESRALHEISGDVPAAEWEVLRTTFNETVRTLHDWERRYRDVFDRAADALFVIDVASGRVLDANPATAALTGVAPEAMIGQTLPAELNPGAVGQRVVHWRRPDGMTQTWGVAASAVQLDGGPATLAAYRDLTGREEMAHSQKMEAVGSLAGGIAHDFNNLLGAVLTGTIAARTLLGPDHPAQVALDGIAHAATRAAELTKQLLSFSRHDPLRLAPVDLGQAIETVGRLCSRTFDRRIDVNAWAPSDLPAVLGDAGEIEQALLNLCINARDAMPAGGSLRIEARRDVLDPHQARSAGVPQPGAYVVVMVADTGTGMSEEVKARLFEPFFTTKETGKGTGLGLSLVYGLMRQLGGAIGVRSVLQRGTRVTLFFPALAEMPDRPAGTPAYGSAVLTPTSTAAARRTPARVDRPLVLLIDDERALREMLRLVLDLSGFEVLEAADGASGVARLRERGADVRAVLLDVQLPGDLSGAETLEHIRALDADVPVLLCTGFVREDELARMRMLRVDDVLLKPLDVNALIARLDRLCRAHRARARA